MFGTDKTGMYTEIDCGINARYSVDVKTDETEWEEMKVKDIPTPNAGMLIVEDLECGVTHFFNMEYVREFSYRKL